MSTVGYNVTIKDANEAIKYLGKFDLNRKSSVMNTAICHHLRNVMDQNNPHVKEVTDLFDNDELCTQNYQNARNTINHLMIKDETTPIAKNIKSALIMAIEVGYNYWGFMYHL